MNKTFATQALGQEFRSPQPLKQNPDKCAVLATIPVRGRQRQGSLEQAGEVDELESESFALGERPCLNTEGGEQSKKTQNVNFRSLYVSTYVQRSLQTCVPILM